MDKFGRNYLLTVQLQDLSPLVIEPPFTLEFDITQNILTSANVCQFRIYNLIAAVCAATYILTEIFIVKQYKEKLCEYLFSLILAFLFWPQFLSYHIFLLISRPRRTLEQNKS